MMMRTVLARASISVLLAVGVLAAAQESAEAQGSGKVGPPLETVKTFGKTVLDSAQLHVALRQFGHRRECDAVPVLHGCQCGIGGFHRPSNTTEQVSCHDDVKPFRSRGCPKVVN